MRKRRPRKIKAWLVTWEWIGDHAKRDDKVAAILNPRLSGKRVREFVELFYLNTFYSLGERIAYTVNKKENPYPARFMDIGGVPWTGAIYCGDNPFLIARLVDDLAVERDGHGEETATWKDRHKPNPASYRPRRSEATRPASE